MVDQTEGPAVRSDNAFELGGRRLLAPLELFRSPRKILSALSQKTSLPQPLALLSLSHFVSLSNLVAPFSFPLSTPPPFLATALQTIQMPFDNQIVCK